MEAVNDGVEEEGGGGEGEERDDAGDGVVGAEDVPGECDDGFVEGKLEDEGSVRAEPADGGGEQVDAAQVEVPGHPGGFALAEGVGIVDGGGEVEEAIGEGGEDREVEGVESEARAGWVGSHGADLNPIQCQWQGAAIEV